MKNQYEAPEIEIIEFRDRMIENSVDLGSLNMDFGECVCDLIDLLA